MEQVKDHGARVKAIEAYLEATFGRAPTSTRNLNVNARVQSDKFFDPDVFANPPPMLGQGAAGQARKALKGSKGKGVG